MSKKRMQCEMYRWPDRHHQMKIPNEREKCVLKAKSIYDNVKEDIQKLDDKINKVEVDEWSDEEDNSVTKGMRNLDKWEGELKEITTMFRKLKDLKTTYNIEEDEVKYEFLEREVTGMEKVFIDVKLFILVQISYDTFFTQAKTNYILEPIT